MEKCERQRSRPRKVFLKYGHNSFTVCGYLPNSEQQFFLNMVLSPNIQKQCKTFTDK